MIEHLFKWLDWSCDTFLKLVVAALFIGSGIYLSVAGGTFGLCLFLIIGSFLRWAFTDSTPRTQDEEA